MAKKKETVEVQDGSNKALDLALATIEKNFGKGAVLRGSSGTHMPGVEFRSSGCMSLDRILGGGWAKGRIVEIYGPESSGKTTLTLHAIAAAQAAGETCAFIDVEHAFDPSYAEALGVDMENLLISQPDSGEQALQIAEALIMSGAVGVVVVDSVSALLPRAEIEKEIGDATVGRQAGLMSQALRKLTGKCAKSGTTLFFINQIRMKIGVMFGNPETTSGGNALKFYASQRVDVRRIKGVKEGDEVVANTTRVKTVKNKVFPPFKQVEFDIRYGEGIDIIVDVLDLSVEAGLVEKAGAWYSYNGEKIGQGKNQARLYLKENPDTFQELWSGLRA